MPLRERTRERERERERQRRAITHTATDNEDDVQDTDRVRGSIKKNRICMRERSERNCPRASLPFIDKVIAGLSCEMKEKEEKKKEEKGIRTYVATIATVIYDNKHLITVNYIAEVHERLLL